MKHRFNPLALLASTPKPTIAPPPIPEVPAAVTPTPPPLYPRPTEPEDDAQTRSSEFAAKVAAACHAAGFPDAVWKTNVFTFRQWRKQDRCVMRGQKGVRVDIQVPRGRPARMITRPIFLFHVSQTQSLVPEAQSAPQMPTRIVTDEDRRMAARALTSSRSAVLPNANPQPVDATIAPTPEPEAITRTIIPAPIIHAPATAPTIHVESTPTNVVPLPSPAPSWKQSWKRAHSFRS